MLSFVGQVTLAKFVLSMLHNHLMQSFYISKSMCDEFDKIVRSYSQAKSLSCKLESALSTNELEQLGVKIMSINEFDISGQDGMDDFERRSCIMAASAKRIFTHIQIWRCLSLSLLALKRCVNNFPLLKKGLCMAVGNRMSTSF